MGEREHSGTSLFLVLCSFIVSSSASACTIMAALRVVTCMRNVPVNTGRMAVFCVSTTLIFEMASKDKHKHLTCGNMQTLWGLFPCFHCRRRLMLVNNFLCVNSRQKGYIWIFPSHVFLWSCLLSCKHKIGNHLISSCDDGRRTCVSVLPTVLSFASDDGEQKVWLVQDFCCCCLSGEHSWPGQSSPAGPQLLAPDAWQLYKLPSCYQINVNVAESSALRY